MQYILEKIKNKITRQAKRELNIEFPPPEIEADLAIPCFKQDPQKLASLLMDVRHPIIDKVAVVGRYVNLTLDKNKLAKEVLGAVDKSGDNYGQQKGKKKVLIEYSSPNIAKPLHIGHLRNTVIGMALKNIYEANGYKVITENWLGDWGKQYGLLILGYQKWHKQGGVTLKDLAKLYSRASKQAEKSKKFNEEAKEIFRQLEKGNKEILKLWKKFREISIRDFKKTYKLIGADFDLWLGESFYAPLMPTIIQETVKKKIAKKDGQAVIVDLSKYGLRSYLLVKGDGASLYSARDLATAKHRLSKYKPEKLIYVVGHEQEFYLKQIFKTLELLGCKKSELQHVTYGIVTLAGKKMSTRAGNIVVVEDILNQAVKKAGKTIGIGAIIYNLLSQGNEKNISFNLKQALNLKGNSAPYIQYGYVRANGIMKKASKLNLKFEIKNLKLISHEAKLAMLLAQYPEVIQKTKELNQPHLIANYLNDLVQEFNRYYENVPILKEEGNVKNFRLLLVKSVAQVIKNGLALLNIKVPEKM
ncbi:MAG: arginine--tRNA ligase [Patescibacteria group bacterium]